MAQVYQDRKSGDEDGDGGVVAGDGGAYEGRSRAVGCGGWPVNRSGAEDLISPVMGGGRVGRREATRGTAAGAGGGRRDPLGADQPGGRGRRTGGCGAGRRPLPVAR